MTTTKKLLADLRRAYINRAKISLDYSIPIDECARRMEAELQKARAIVDELKKRGLTDEQIQIFY